MEEDENEAQASKLARVENGSDGNRNRFHSWHHSSRIIRVSRASGGKDRHSKVMTSKGLRDRRVRLSVSTAIQFYDLQDRLGYDQPSKAVEWLIKSAADAIAELPSLNNTYPPNCDEKGPRDEQEVDDENDANHQQTNNNNNQSQNISLSKSACSSNSETSKGSGLSLSRSANRVKARERARERTAKEREKEKENESHTNIANHHHNVNTISQTASFTELLTGGMNNVVPTGTTSPNQNNGREQWSSSSLSAPMDYLSSGLLGPSSSSRIHHMSEIQLGHNSLPETMLFHNNSNNSSYSNYSQLQQFSLMPEHHHHHHHQLMSTNGNDYNLNFSISSYNRGTLQSNSPSLFPHFIDGSTVPFFLGAAPTIQHKFSSDHKGKAKN